MTPPPVSDEEFRAWINRVFEQDPNPPTPAAPLAGAATTSREAYGRAYLNTQRRHNRVCHLLTIATFICATIMVILAWFLIPAMRGY
jgi:hypothetical protein